MQVDYYFKNLTHKMHDKEICILKASNTHKWHNNKLIMCLTYVRKNQSALKS